MATDKQPMTLTGKAMLEAELKRLLTQERPSVIRAIEEARGHGDLSENADYDAAKERQAFVEARISEIQGKLVGAEVVDPKSIKADRVVFGATVVLQDLDTDDEVTYQIVGEDEADVKNGKISVFSPLARSMIGKRAGDVVEFKSPKGEREYEILSFKFV
ncbi:MAG: transcription elongation factor GreA [Bdellovibrionaceae bacterium]|nr:transcription elongation factor GreA [Bdellovibrionales bacterium]MCB9084211.1 transcription elongation factor GreA [Pseudobdellovibrionaceae bacterium]